MSKFETDVEDMEPESSTGPDDVQDADAVEASTDEADPSAAGVEEKDTRSIVRDVVDAGAEPEASPADDEEETEATGAEDDEDFSKVPFAAHPRFQELLAQRREFKGDALEYRKIRTFLDESGVSGQEAGEALQVAALAKTNPVECFTRLKPWLKSLAIAAGEILPDDLAARVQKGDLALDTAFEISRANAKTASVAAQQAWAQKRGETQQSQQHRAGLQGAAADWEKGRKLRDPNFAKKLPLMRKELVWLQKVDGMPSTPEGVKAQLKKAYDNVGAVFTQTEAMKQRSQRPTAGKASQAPAAAAPGAPVALNGRKPAIKPVISGQVNGNAQIPATSTLALVRANRRI